MTVAFTSVPINTQRTPLAPSYSQAEKQENLGFGCVCTQRKSIHTDYTIKLVLTDAWEFVEQRSVLCKSSKSQKNMQNSVFPLKKITKPKKQDQGTPSALRMDKLRQIKVEKFALHLQSNW